MSRLPTPGGDRNTWGILLNDFLSVEHNADGALKRSALIDGAEQVSHKGLALGYAPLDAAAKVPAANLPIDLLVVNVKDHGAVGDGSTDDTAAMQSAITGSVSGAIIFFPAGTYIISATLLLKANRTYLGAGRTSVIKQKNATLIPYMMDIASGEPSPRTDIRIEDIFLDGNRASNTVYTGGSGFAQNNGLRLFNCIDCTLRNVTIRHCGRDGLVLDGSGEDYDHTTATCHFYDMWLYDNARYGVDMEVNSSDNHIYNSDLGYNDYGSAILLSGSNSINGSALWGTKFSSGITIGASTNLLRNCQIEGNAQHGVTIAEFGNHTQLIGNKIYANGDTIRSYDGIYIEGSVANPVVGTTMLANSFYSELLFGTPGPARMPRHAITLDTHTSESVITGNQHFQLGPDGTISSTILSIFGLKTGDVLDGKRWVSSGSLPTNGLPGEQIYVVDLGITYQWSHYRTAWEALLTGRHSTLGGTYAVGIGDLSTGVTFTDRFDTAYSVTVVPYWETTFWITAKTSTGFTVNFGTAPPSASSVDWTLVRHYT